MGFYTQVKAELKIQRHRHDQIRMLLAFGDWKALATGHVEFVEYANWDRANMIPFALSVNNDHKKPSFEDGVFKFECEFKNYEGTLDAFLKIVPLISCGGTIDVSNDERVYQNLWHHYVVKEMPMSFELVDVGWDNDTEPGSIGGN